MKKEMFFAIVMPLFMTGCIKTNVNEIIANTKSNTSPDYSLQFENAIKGRTNYTQSLNLDPGASAAAYTIKASMLQLRVGHTEPTAGIPMVLYVRMNFPSFTKPESIAGTYKFPEANQNISLQLTEIIGGETTSRSLPDSGNVEIKFDATTKTLNGKFNDIQFRQSLAGRYFPDRLSGKFNHVSLEN